MKSKLPLIIVIVVVIILIIVALLIDKEPGEKTNLKSADLAEQIYGFTAEIKEIQDKLLILEAWLPALEEDAELIKGTVTAFATDETEIVKLVFPEDPTSEPVFPEEIDMAFDDLKVGDKIDIGTIENVYENLKNEEEFELSHIFLIE